jgi:hypothetical protein
MNLQSWMESLRDLTPRLNAVTDAAVEAVMAVERFLGEIKLGIAAAAPLEHKPGRRLAYGRINGQYRIHVAIDLGPDHHAQRIEWANLSRQEKLESACHLDDLLDEIAVKVEKLLSETEDIQPLLRELADAIGEVTPPPKMWKSRVSPGEVG